MKRIPRPLGFTSLAYQYQKDPSKKNKKRLRSVLIRAFIQEALLIPERQEYQEWTRVDKKTAEPITAQEALLNKKTKTEIIPKTKHRTILRTIKFDELAKGLGISVGSLEIRVNKELHRMGEKMVSQQAKFNSEYLTRAMVSRLFFRSLEGLEKASNWADEVRHQTRIGGYRASNIMASNTASSTELGWLKSSFDIGNRYHAKSSINYTKNQSLHLHPNGEENGPEMVNGTQFLTPTMAQKMIEEKGLNPIPSQENGMLDLIRITNGLDMPGSISVKATKGDAQGTASFNPADRIAKINHTNRRQEEMGLDDYVDVDIEE